MCRKKIIKLNSISYIKPILTSISLSIISDITENKIKNYKNEFNHNIPNFGLNKFTAEKNRFLESLRKERIQKRTLEYKEELIANVFHPKRIKKMLLTDIEYLDMI